MPEHDEAVIVHEWEDEREAGTLHLRLIDGGPHQGFWLETRFGDEVEWTEEDLDGPGFDLLARFSEILAAERLRVRRELLEEEKFIMYGESPTALRDVLDRVCPEEP